MARFEHPQLIRRARQLQQLSLRTKRVLYTKIALVIVFVLVMAVMLLLPLANEQSGLRIAFTGPAGTAQKPTQPVMERPKYQGVDQKDQPFTVTADRAVQKDTNTVLLSNVQADLTTADKAWISVTSNDGVLQLDKQLLTLNGRVHMFHDAGYEMTTEQVTVNTHTGDAQSVVPMDGQGPAGVFHAQGFNIYDKGQRMVFNGRVTMTLVPHAS